MSDEQVVHVREIPRPGTDPVFLSTDTITRDVIVFDVDGDTLLTLPPWVANRTADQVTGLVLSLLQQADALAVRAKAMGRTQLRHDLARLLGLTIAEPQL